MSEWTLTGALAVPFTTTAETFTFQIGATVYTASLPAGTWRIALASASADALRVLAASMLAATPSAPMGMTVSVEVSDAGVCVLTSNNAFKLLTLHNTALGKALGFTAATASPALVVTATRPPWYVAFFCALYGGAWRPVRHGAIERTAGGSVYALAGTLTTWDRDLRAELVPWGPAEATEAGTPATPFYPLAPYREHLGETSADRVWGLCDVWVAAQNASARGGCALTLSWQSVKASTSETFDVGALAAPTLEPERQDERWQRWINTRFSFVLPASGQTGTRA